MTSNFHAFDVPFFLTIFLLVFFSNGLLDPWSGGGVMKEISSTIFTVIIPESAHHLDLRAANPADPDSVKQARKRYKKIFRTWLDEHYHTSSVLKAK